MKKVILKTGFVLMIILAVNVNTFAQSIWDGTHTIWTKGTGTKTNPYLIENAAQLAHLAYYVNNGTDAVNYVVGSGKYWKLTIDINLNSLSWNPIGYLISATDHYEFGGHFDGGEHTIANLVTSGKNNAGLFGRMSGGSVENVGITGSSTITGQVSTGGIVGWTTGDVTIKRCYNTATVSSATSNAGGIIGAVSEGNIAFIDCYNTGAVSVSSSSNNENNVGGIVGVIPPFVGNATFDNCYNTGDISATHTSSYWCNVGGIVGIAASADINTTINNCYNTGKIHGTSTATVPRVGGITGQCTGPVNNCYNTGNISTGYPTFGGGIIGYIVGGGSSAKNCYYLGGSAPDAGGGIAKTASFMKTQELVDLLNSGPTPNSAYKLDELLVNNGFPVLIWKDDEPETPLISGKVMREDQSSLSAGMVELYKLSPYTLVASVPIGNNGNYLFSDVSSGDYIVKAIPPISENGLPTYYGNSENWHESTTITVSTTPLQEMNITIIPILDMEGSSAISGYVYEEAGAGKGISNTQGENPAQDISVYLQRYQTDWKTVSNTLTDANGYYKFANIPAGVYRVILDIVGIPMNDIPTIDLADGEEIEGINYTVTNEGIFPVGIDQLKVENEKLKIYPNPTRGEIQVTSYELQVTSIEIYDVMGRKVTPLNPPEGGRLPSFGGVGGGNIAHLPNGVYFLKIQTEKGIITKKIIKN